MNDNNLATDHQIDWKPTKSKHADADCSLWRWWFGAMEVAAYNRALYYNRSACPPRIIFVDYLPPDRAGDFSCYTLDCRISPGRPLNETLNTAIHELGHYIDYYINGLFEGDYIEQRAWDQGEILLITCPWITKGQEGFLDKYRLQAKRTMEYIKTRAQSAGNSTKQAK